MNNSVLSKPIKLNKKTNYMLKSLIGNIANGLWFLPGTGPILLTN